MAWRVGKIQEFKDHRSNFAGSGFILQDSDKPLFIFGFNSPEDASAAAKQMSELIKLSKVKNRLSEPWE
jgi:hypothetical protein